MSNGSLLISDVVWSDQGIYHCTATNPVLGIVRTSSSAQLTAIGMQPMKIIYVIISLIAVKLIQKLINDALCSSLRALSHDVINS